MRIDLIKNLKLYKLYAKRLYVQSLRHFVE